MAGNVCDRYCDGCIYRGLIGGDWYRYCKYLLDKGERRPCPPGKGCTVKLTARRGKLLTIDGETKSVTEWAEITGISKFVIYSWIKRHGRVRTEQKVRDVWKGGGDDG